MLTRDQILKAKDRKTETLNVPEWGGEVIVSAMSGHDRDAFEASIVRADGRTDMANMRAKLVAACVVDEAGNRLFQPADIEALGGKSSSALDRIVSVAQRLNRLGDQQLEELKGN
jgi:hypothetical protein